LKIGKLGSLKMIIFIKKLQKTYKLSETSKKKQLQLDTLAIGIESKDVIITQTI